MTMLLRQGDVLLIPIDSIPRAVALVAQAPASRDATSDKPTEKGFTRVVLAHGEVTGHAHACHRNATLYRSEADVDQRFLKVGGGGALLKHEEHATVPLAEGNYRVVIQREYHPEEIRNVAD